MEVKVSYKDKSMILEYTANDEEIKILTQTKRDGYIEFRSLDKPNLKIDLCLELEREGFLCYDDDAWHTTYKLTEKGINFIENILNQNNND